MHVVDPVGELERELRRVEVLVREVARIEVDPERLTVADRVQGLPRRDEVVRDLRRVHLEAELDAFLVEDVHDRAPPFGEVLVPALDLGEVIRRKRVDQVPDRGAREAVHLPDAQPRGCTCRVLHPLGCARANALRLAVAVDLGRENRPVTLVDAVADRLADEMRADRENVQMVALQDLLLRPAVAVVLERLVDLEVVAPAGELETVEAPAAGLRGKILERQVGPLAGEQRDGTGHRDASLVRA